MEAMPVLAQMPTSRLVPAVRAAPEPAPRTPWGHPDLQGTWDYRTITPLERPREFGTREFYTDEEVKTLESRAGRRMDGPPEEIRPGLTHAQYWTDPGRTLSDSRRTSLIVDPPDGRIPAVTAEGRARQARQPNRAGTANDRGSTAATRSAASPTAFRTPACRRSTTTTSRSCRRRIPPSSCTR
jgi:hypothetical protein